MRQDQSFGGAKSAIKLSFRCGVVMNWAKSTGFLSWLSVMLRGAPLINNDLTGLVDFKVSTLLTAKCKGV